MTTPGVHWLLYTSSEDPVIWLVKRAGIVLTVPAKPVHSQSELSACCVPHIKITATHTSMFSRSYYAKITSCGRCSHFKIIILVKILSKWVIFSNLSNCHFCSFHSVYKTNIDCFLFGAQFKIIGPRWCQNHDHALIFALGVVMVLTLPWAYNF